MCVRAAWGRAASYWREHPVNGTLNDSCERQVLADSASSKPINRG
jgi:hypothetical protein